MEGRCTGGGGSLSPPFRTGASLKNGIMLKIRRHSMKSMKERFLEKLMGSVCGGERYGRFTQEKKFNDICDF